MNKSLLAGESWQCEGGTMGKKSCPMYFCLRTVPLRGPRQSIHFTSITEQKEITTQHSEIQDPLGKNAALT